MKAFDSRNERLANQFLQIRWRERSGFDEAALTARFDALMANEAGLSRAMIKAATYALIAEYAPIAIDEDDMFQDKLFGGNFFSRQRSAWEKEVVSEFLADEAAARREGWQCGAYTANADYGHTSPNSRLLLEIGAVGLLDRIMKAATREGLTARRSRKLSAIPATRH